MYRQSEKNLLSRNISSTCPHNMVNFGPLASEIVSLVWWTPANFNRFRVFAALLRGTLLVGVSQTAALNIGRHLYSAGRPSRWALAHISSLGYIFMNRNSSWCLSCIILMRDGRYPSTNRCSSQRTSGSCQQQFRPGLARSGFSLSNIQGHCRRPAHLLKWLCWEAAGECQPLSRNGLIACFVNWPAYVHRRYTAFAFWKFYALTMKDLFSYLFSMQYGRTDNLLHFERLWLSWLGNI